MYEFLAFVNLPESSTWPIVSIKGLRQVGQMMVNLEERTPQRLRGFLLSTAMSWTVYILFSAKLDRYYTGCASDVDLRLEKHRTNFFGNTVFTSKAEGWEVLMTILCESEKQAKAVELHIKKMKSKKYIQNMKSFPELVAKLLTRYVSHC